MGGHPGDLVPGPIAVTRMACPEPAMAAESRYLDALAAVTNLSFQATSLALTWRRGDGIESMIFELKPAGSAETPHP
jgi:heat shock protein HslJ